jgi:hypothetical protein
VTRGGPWWAASGALSPVEQPVAEQAAAGPARPSPAPAGLPRAPASGSPSPSPGPSGQGGLVLLAILAALLIPPVLCLLGRLRPGCSAGRSRSYRPALLPG